MDLSSVATTTRDSRPRPALADVAHTLRRHIVHLAADSAGAHLGGSMSGVEILTLLLFHGVLRVDPHPPKMEGPDYPSFPTGPPHPPPSPPPPPPPSLPPPPPP